MRILWKDPEPSFQNVVPNGEGWYEFSNGKWRKITNPSVNGGRWLSHYELSKFAKQAIEILRNK